MKIAPAPWTVEHGTEVYDARSNPVCDCDSNGNARIRTENEDHARLISAVPMMYRALDALDKARRLLCIFDVLNPCWDNRSTDKPGLHWGSDENNTIPACPNCVGRAALAQARGDYKTCVN